MRWLLVLAIIVLAGCDHHDPALDQQPGESAAAYRERLIDYGKLLGVLYPSSTTSIAPTPRRPQNLSCISASGYTSCTSSDMFGAPIDNASCMSFGGTLNCTSY
jgi:hypothetical protein